MTESISIARPDDFHLHLRGGAMLKAVAPYAAPWGRVLVMPNLSPPILNGPDAVLYKYRILSAFESKKIDCEPLMTIQLTENTTPGMIFEAHKLGVTAAKVYPKGQTTNSDNGVIHYEKLTPALEAMSECNMVLCLHGESPDNKVFCLDRETEFLEILEWLAHSEKLRRLRIVLEHITTELAVDLIRVLPENFAATITLHHLLLTLNDVIGDKFETHLFCKPVAKRKKDRDALIRMATSGHEKFFFGSDSAPHLRENKEAASCCAGIFSAPVALPLLAQTFEHYNSLENLEAFVSKNGRDFYELSPNKGKVMMVKEPWVVPKVISGIIPFWAGKEISWQIQ